MNFNINTLGQRNTADTARNTEMGILTGIAMLLVVLGHLDMNELSVFGLFPYYSFHVMVFMFVSGYFYSSAEEDAPLRYIGRKARRLLAPYFIWNLVYGVVSEILYRNGFLFCSPITVKNLFIEPFLGGHQFGLNFASWFVPALFITETVNILARRLIAVIGLNDDRLRIVHIDRDILVFASSLVLGIITVWLSQGSHVWGLYKTPGRILFMLPVYELGVLYRSHLERAERRIPDIWCMAGLCLIQMIIYIAAGGRLNFSAVWVTSFAGSPILPYLTTVTGTWFWLRVSRMLKGTAPGRAADMMGRYSFHIMMHHVAVFYLINLIMLGVSAHTAFAPAFDMTAFHSDVVYTCLPMDMYIWKNIFWAAGIAVPVCIARLADRVIHR